MTNKDSILKIKEKSFVKRISIQRLSTMQIAVDYFNRRIKNIDAIPFYFECYKFFYLDSERKEELSSYRFGNTFIETLFLNENEIQLFEDYDSWRWTRRIKVG